MRYSVQRFEGRLSYYIYEETFPCSRGPLNILLAMWSEWRWMRTWKICILQPYIDGFSLNILNNSVWRIDLYFRTSKNEGRAKLEITELWEFFGKSDCIPTVKPKEVVEMNTL